jgi:hypothetical protein
VSLKGPDAKTKWLAVNHQFQSNFDFDIESAESWSCEKRETGSWDRGEFGNPEDEERLALETATKQQLMNNEKSLCVL